MNDVYKNRWFILPVILLGIFMATLDSSIVNVALPNIAEALHVGIGSIQWVVTSYLMAISSFILIFGRIADLKGKKNIYQIGFIIFSLGSLFCGLSYSITLLVLSRVVQAIGAAMIMSCSQGLITYVFPPNERGRALGLSGATVALGTMIGPPLGGIIVGLSSWEYIFLINVPIGIFAFIAGKKLLPIEKIEKAESFDTTGAVFFVLTIVTLFWPLLEGETLGWGNIYILSSLVLSFIFGAWFFVVERKRTHPMLDFELFKNKLFTVSIICGFISFMALFCTNIIHPYFLQRVLKASPSTAGLLMIIYPMTMAVIAPFSGYLSDKIGSEVLTVVGLVVTALGLTWMSTLNTNSGALDVILRMALLGAGNGFFQSPNNSLVMSSAPRDKLGIAGSVNALIRNLGMVFGIAFSMFLLYNRMSYVLGYKVQDFVEGRPDAFIYAMRIIYISAAVLCLLGVALTYGRMRARRKKTAV